MAFKERHKKFCEDYVAHGNAALAYRSAFGDETAKNSDVMAAQLMRREDVQNYIQLKQSEVREKFKITVETLINYHMKIVELHQQSLTLISKESLTPEEEERLQKIKGVVRSVDYNRALQEIARLQGLYQQETNLNVNTRKVIKVQMPGESGL
jgi:phage terminase small subunit